VWLTSTEASREPSGSVLELAQAVVAQNKAPIKAADRREGNSSERVKQLGTIPIQRKPTPRRLSVRIGIRGKLSFCG
jgi:hypothetical protein